MTDKRSIDLGRTFVEVRDLQGETDPESLLQAAFAAGPAKTWDQVLTTRHVVVLGEAGTGKTTEFRRQTEFLDGSGTRAFFIEIVALARDGLRAGLLIDEEARLDAWQASDEEAVFFLDSLDEAKLQQRTLREALVKLQRELREQWSRVRFVISCRVSDWRETDRVVVEQVVPEGGQNSLVVCSIAPLEGSQLALMASHVGVRDVQAFLAAVNNAYAQAFVERPLDVEWLGAYWNKFGRIGSLRELIAENVGEKLSERSPQRASTLALDKSRQGARAMAGILTLTRRLSVSLPSDPVDLERAHMALDTAEVLADWSRVEIEDLLRKGLFDESTYGRVRFHHRTVQDYLAARWLHELRTSGLPLHKIRDLFLREEEGERVVPQHLAPVLAWLCLWDAPLRAEMIPEVPAILIAYGDPSGFGEEDRIRVLRAYAGCYQSRRRLFNDFEVASLERFATPALAGAVTALLGQQDQPEELAALLFELIELGGIQTCLPSAMRVALDSGHPRRARMAAIRAVAAVGDPKHRRSLLTLVDATATWLQDVAGVFVRALYPDVLGVDGLMQVLAKCEPKRKNFVTILQGVLEYDVPKRGDPELRLHLLKGFVALVRVESRDGTLSVASGREWMLRALGHVVGAVLDDLPSGADQPVAVARALQFFRWCNEKGMRTWYGVDQVQEAVARHPEVRRALFWERVDEHRQATGRVPRNRFELRYRHDLFELTDQDISWLVKDARSRPDLRERLLAFDALAVMPRSAEANEQHLEVLRALASKNEALAKRLQRLLARPVVAHPLDLKWAREKRARELRSERTRQESRANLEAAIDEIRDGSNLSALLFLLRKAQEHGHSNRWGVASTGHLRELFGVEIATAADEGWRAFWRGYEPSLPHERERNSTPWQVVLGLVGLAADFASGLDAASLDERLVEKVARYAANELNGFPDWFGRVVSVHSAAVCTALECTIAADFRATEDVHDVLGKLAYAESATKAACAPAVLDLIANSEPPTLKALKEAIGLILSTDGLDLKRLDAIVAERSRAARGDLKRFGVWWLTWVVRDGGAAVEFLEQLIRESTRDTAYGFVEEICHRIHDGIERAPIALRHDLATLMRMVPIAYDFIAIQDDIEHENCFSPGRRDNAQEIRSVLVKWIAEIPGSEAIKALRTIADDPRVSTVREWILHQADSRTVKDAGVRSPAVEAELVGLYREHGTQAKSLMTQLTQVMNQLKILFLAANPSSSQRLELGEEARQIQQKLRASELRDSIAFVLRPAVQPGDLQQVLLEDEPTIVHFSGHGGGTSGLVFHRETGGAATSVSGDALRNLFRVLRDRVQVVVLNACFSDEQAGAIVDEIEFVVGMSDSIGDQAAIRFSAAFYRGLGFGRSVQGAFDLGVSEMQLHGQGIDALVPRLLSRKGADPAATVLLPRTRS